MQLGHVIELGFTVHVMDEIRTILNILLEQRKPDERHFGGMGMGECQKKIQKSLQHPKVKFLLEQLEKSGCSINPNNFIKAFRCRVPAIANYIPGRGVVICCNYLRFQDEVNQGVIHELIHAYDDCRVKNMDWRSCYHRACAEIRASHLSGDCHYMREFLQGHTNIRGHEPDCVRRRATTSVKAFPSCSEYITKLALEAVWDTCYNDTKPFDKAP